MLKRTIMVRMACVMILLGFGMITPTITVQAETYTYDFWQQPMPSKDGFKVRESGIIYGQSIDLSVPTDEQPVHVRHMTDLFVRNDHYFLVDREVGRVAKLTRDFETVHVFEGIPIETEEGPAIQPFQSPRGVFVTHDGEVYITDYTGEYIAVFDATYTFERIITMPEHPTYGSRPFLVSKIVLDRTKRIYVTVGNVYDGIVELTNQGEFSRFYGVQAVSVNPVDLLWRRFMTDEQLARTVLFLPVEYTNMAIDHEGFIYATATADSGAPIQRLNPSGNDVLRRNGYVQPIGDVVRHPRQPRSSFVSIAVNDFGMYSVLDRANRRVFTYNDEGFLIYVTGGQGDLAGQFRTPTSVSYDGEWLLVTDSTLNTVTVFTPTDFGARVNEALSMTYMGEYLEVAELWEAIIQENTNFSYAYIGIGHHLFRQGLFEEAMQAYELGFYHRGYSRAFEQHRKQLLRENFSLIGFTAIALIGLTIIRPIVMDLRRGESE